MHFKMFIQNLGIELSSTIKGVDLGNTMETQNYKGKKPWQQP